MTIYISVTSYLNNVFDGLRITTVFDKLRLTTVFDKLRLTTDFDKLRLTTDFDKLRLTTVFDKLRLTTVFNKLRLTTVFDKLRLTTNKLITNRCYKNYSTNLLPCFFNNLYAAAAAQPVGTCFYQLPGKTIIFYTTARLNFYSCR